MKRNPILTEDETSDNPLGMLTNLFENPGAENMEIIMKEGNKVKKYSPSETDNQTIGSKGRRVGSAYQLENGEIIYIPE